ncbi:amino acid adenylation domain-containing protein, partial [Undibacterium sp. TJN19]|uniref:amino acid adenylation domain-containing protein n=1 Tax=Undibacterium sp. TJN19 TaxID=3413055 RepID=UPI003BF29F32
KEAAIQAWVLEEKARGLRIDELWRIGILVFEQQIQFGLSFHHALWDGWSDASLVAELFTHYKTLLQGQPLVVLPSPPSYQTYIALEQAALASPVHRDYWTHSLAGAKQAWWSAHPHQQSSHFFCDITADMSTALIALADQLGVQEKSVWCTVYLVLTSLLEGDDHILGSVVTHGRPEIDGAEKMVGLFLNSLPLQVDIGSGSWADLIRQVHARLNQHQAHRHYPLAQIQADLRLDFAGSLFNFTNFHVIGNAGAASNVTGSGSFGLDETNYLFSVDVQKHDAANRHLLRITLDPTVFDDAFQHRIARYVPHILTTMTQELALPVNKARLLGEEYRTLMQYSRGEYASSRAASTPVASVCQLFEEQARQQPQAIAIVHGNEQLSYGELNRRANQLAHYLRARGVGTDQLVALCVERSLEMVIGLLGIWKAGGAYVPLDPAYPPERLAYVIEDARPQLILTQASLAARLPLATEADSQFNQFKQCSLVLLDQDWPAIAREAASNGAAVALSPQADDLAYVMYTSGSTGQPKGVMVAQRNVLNHNLFVCREFALSASDRILQFATVSFDAAVEEIFPVLMAGGSLILRAALTPSASELSTQVLHQGITVLDLPTAYWHAWIGTVDSDYLGQSALRLIVVGGEVVSVDSFQQWTRVARPHQVWMNTYGPTEATVICTVYRQGGQGGQVSARHALPAYLDAREISYPYAPLLHQLFEAQVQHNPDAIAVVVEDQQLTYAELNKKTNQLAHTLRAQGVGPDQLVAICVERSLEMVIGLLGILKAGGAYIPLEPSYPAERLAQMVKDAAPRVLLTQERFAALLPPHGGRTILLDSQWAEMADQEDSNLAAEVIGLTAANLAYVIYTSGSTGQPKGAMNEHRAVVNRLRWMQDQYGLTAHDKVLQKTPFSFDVSVWEFFWPLLNGASLVFARPEGHQDPAYLRGLIQAQGITTLHFVPSMLQAFLEQTEELTECASLRRIVCSGEELPVALQARCLAALPQASLHNLYGPTEAAIDVTYWECRAGEDLDRVPIGRPIANTQMYILDAGRHLVPTGVAGEIYIGGAGVARGYLHRPALTAERFVADLLSEQPGARMYRTGDLGRWRADGHIEYLGRNDQQVKIRGFRIELGEIEAQLLQQAQVREAVVVARERAGAENQGAEGSDTDSARQEKQLVAYLVGPADGNDASNELSSEALRGQLKAVLPEYMVPAAFVWLPALPLTPNGKLDRRALPAPGQEAFAVGLYAVPQGEVEVLLAGIWQTLLGLERVGRHDHFFDLGGHSLLALQLLTRVRQGLGRELALRDLFAHPTIAALAKVLAGQGTAVLVGEEIGRADRDLPLPLSFAQQRLW